MIKFLRGLQRELTSWFDIKYTKDENDYRKSHIKIQFGWGWIIIFFIIMQML